MELISRAAALDVINTWCRQKSEKVRMGLLHRDLDASPAVDAALVVHARPVWINPLDPGAKICTWKCSSLCSACGEYVAVGWKHCQNCGAKMDADKNLAFADQSGAEYADNPTV